MSDLNFDPAKGEEVRVLGLPGLFQIVDVQPPNRTTLPPGLENNFMGVEGGRTVDLKREGSDVPLRGVPWAWLQYVDETRPVRRMIEWLRTNPGGREYPDYVVGYEVSVGEDHEGNPSVFVRFYADPSYLYENGRLSEDKIAGLSQFLDDVRRELDGLGLDRWIYVRAGEARGALDVAS